MRGFAILFLAAFSSSLLSAATGDTGTAFTSVCPSCANEHRIPAPEGVSASLQLVCARCGSIVDILQPDSSGRLHRPTWYLRLDEPPLDASAAELWLWVRTQVRYVKDGSSHRVPEAWQLARETYRWRTGDCEDSAILLADWLRARGYEAYVAAGRVGTAPHAWVVLIHGGETYLLETTGAIGPGRRIPPLAGLLTDYNPTGFVFDEKSIRVRRDEGWTADYRSAERWKELLLQE